MELSSYDELLQQVESLKAENCTLRQELADNSNHLNKLENEASTMKEALSHLQGTMDGRPDSLMTENDCEGILDNRANISQSTCSSELENVNNTNWQAQLLQLERERARIVQDIDAEEKEKQWYLVGLERINHQLIELSNTNGFAGHKDIVLQKQLEQDADSLQEAMQQKLGTRGEMQRREEARFHSICLIDKEIEKLFPEEHRESVSKFFNGHLVKDRTDSYLDLQNEFPNGKNLDAELSSKMTTSGTQTMGRFSTESLSPPPPPGGDLGNLSSVYHGTWPVDKVLWHSGPSSLGGNNSIHSFRAQDNDSVTSFKSSVAPSYRIRTNNQQLGTKVEMVYSLLSMLGSHDKDDMSRKLLNMSSSVDSCIAMRQSGCLPLLIELLHGDDKDGITEKRRPSRDTRQRASQALHNIVHSHPDDKRGRREARVLRLLEQIREYCNSLRDSDSGSDEEQPSPDGANADQHPVPAMAMVMKLSFDEEHRHAMCQLGGLQTIAELVQIDYETHGNMNDQYCITLRRYAGMALTNLTFGDGTNKALLCSLRPFMRALVSQLHSPSEDLRQVIASVLRNLSWRADPASKKTLREVGTVATLMKASMEAKKESTLKSILSALWNLSAHCSINKANICDVDGALAFLVGTLTYKSPSKTHAIIENGGGILRNISSHIAIREEYRATLRKHNCLQILLQHLRSPSLTIVSNACGTLWNLSARCTEDQETLWDMGAVGMLRNLVNSKHKMISMGSSAALKNLLAAKPGGLAAAADKNKSGAPSLLVRKQKFLEAELDQSLSETCENLDSPKTSPTHHRSDGEPKYGNPKNNPNQTAQKDYHAALGPYQLHGRMYHSVGGQLPPKHIPRSESKESIVSTQSDSSHDRLRNLNILLRNRQAQYQEQVDSISPSSALTAPAGVLESRIQYVMQEVTRQIALEKSEMIQSDCGARVSYLKSASSKSSPDSTLSMKTPKFVRSTNNNSETISQISRNAILDKYSNLTSMIENLSLEDGENSDQPINYSLKYSEEADRCLENKLLEADSETLITPKIDNCSSDERNKDLNRNALRPNYVKSPDQTNAGWQESLSKQQAAFKLNSHQTMYSHYAETDLDDPDQPTNYSLLYTEDTDTTDNFCPPAPEDERPYFTQEYTAKGPSMHDDTLMTYCTEDTPLNFSTATSLTDLREIKEEINLDCVDDLSEDKCSEVNQKESNGNEEFIDKNNDSKVSESCSLLAEKGSDIGENNESQENAFPDKSVSYCVEGTPVCFSRVSSLSSIHSNDDVDEPQSSLPQPENIEQSPPQRSMASSADGINENLEDKQKHQEDINKVSDFGKDFKTEDVVDKTRPIMVTARSDIKPTTNNSEGKTVTFGEDHYAEETPLMFSRCSSLGSLSSFDQHSIHDDHSSVISDFSRRASEVVSPSDLPDSPGQSRPSSPRFNQSQIQFPAKGQANDTRKQGAVQTPPLVPETKGSPSAKPCINVFEDSPHVFAEEGTPLQFSQATSLSSLPLCYDASEDNEDSSKQDHSNLGSCGSCDDKHSSPDSSDSVEYQLADKCSPDGDSQDHGNLSEGEENEDDLLEACINSAMPNNTRSEKHKHNNTKLYSRINVLSGSNSRMIRAAGSGIPVKASNLKVGYGGISLHPSSSVAMSGCAGAAMAQSKAINKVPSSQDHTSCDQMSKYNCKADSSNGRDSNSDTSSVFDDDNDNILAQCIQSGMPKASPPACNNVVNAKHAGNLLNQKAESADKQGYHKAHFCQTYSSSSAKETKENLPYRHQTVSCNGDVLTTYVVESTPVNFSTATSLSDLTIDSVCDSPVEHQQSDWPASKQLPRSRFVAGSEMKFNDLSTSKNLQSNYSTEIAKVNKTCDSEVSNKVNASSSHSAIKPYNIPLENTSKFSKTTKIDHRSCLEDATKSYAVENTPLCLSHGSSLSSLSGFTPGEDAERSNVEFQHEQHMKFDVEDTPVCFSRNSSLSSLSIESLGVETTPLEQALLDECIRSGMPKSRPPDGSSERKSVRSRGSKLPCAIGSKERHSIHSRTAHKMDSILETGQSDVENRLRSNDQEDLQELNFTESKNSEDAAVAVSTDSTAAEDTMKEDITIRADEKETSAAKNFSKFDLSAEQTHPNEKDKNVLYEVYSENAEMMQVNDREDTQEIKPLHTDESSPLSQSEEIIGGALIAFEATKLAAVVQEAATKSPEEMEQSMVSQSSELVDNVNPPSLMAELLSDSMQSSGPSDSFGTQDRRGSVDSKRIPPTLDQVQAGKGHFPSRSRNVPELVMRALADVNAAPKPPSLYGSLENLSMRSSVVGDFIDNVKPPSLLEDVDMASSTYSVCSIVSEVADSKSDNLSADYSLGSDVFRCLKPVVAMAELYARDGNLAASRHSNFSVSEIIENVNPPSTFLEISNTMNDCTEVGTHTLENNNDTDIEDDLPSDPEPFKIREKFNSGGLNGHVITTQQTCTFATQQEQQAFYNKINVTKRNNDAAEDDDEFLDDHRVSEDGELDITPEEVLVLREDANLVLSTLNEIQFSDMAGEESLMEDMLIEYETLSLVSNESDSSRSTSETRDTSGTPHGSPIINRGPRIVKPLNRDAVRQHTSPKEEDRNGPKPIRGRRRALYPRQQVITSFTNTRFSSPKPKEMAVKPTRTSALRATQSQQKVMSGGSVKIDNGGNCSPVQRRPLPRNSSPLGSSGELKVAKPPGKGTSTGNPNDELRPKPPIKQGTFTKDMPSQRCPPKISPTKTRIPTFGGISPVEGQKPSSQGNVERPPRGSSAHIPARHRSKLGPSKSLDDSSDSNPCSPKTAGKLLTVGVCDADKGKTWSRRGQSSSPIMRSQCGASTTIIKTTAIRNSPSSHSLGGGKKSANLVKKVNGLSGSFSGAKRSSSNASLCSNSSSSTTNSRKSSGGSSAKKETQSKIASIWKSRPKKSSVSGDTANSTPREGMSRSSTYETISSFSSPNLPRHDIEAEHSTAKPGKGAETYSEGVDVQPEHKMSKEKVKALAEARLRKWEARKARQAARKNEETRAGVLVQQESTRASTSSSGAEPHLLESSTSSIESEGKRCQRLGNSHNVPNGFKGDAPLENDDTSCQESANNNNNPAEVKGPASAIVSPFNYIPSSHISGAAMRSGAKAHSRSLIPTLNHVVVSPSLRQADAYVHSVEGDNIVDPKHPCMVTTV